MLQGFDVDVHGPFDRLTGKKARKDLPKLRLVHVIVVPLFTQTQHETAIRS